MKPHPRIRKTVKWGGAVVAGLLVVVWIWSGLYHLGWGGRGGAFFSMGAGRATLGLSLPAEESPTIMPGMHIGRNTEFNLSVWYRYLRIPGHVSWLLQAPLWAVALPLVGITAFAWRQDTLARRRARLNFCPKCNYDRTGLAPGVVCPECGTAPRLGP